MVSLLVSPDIGQVLREDQLNNCSAQYSKDGGNQLRKDVPHVAGAFRCNANVVDREHCVPLHDVSERVTFANKQTMAAD